MPDSDIALMQKCADLTFLALTTWREASSESYQAKLALSYSIIERVKKPTWWGHDVQSVVFKKWQYSSMTAPGDSNLVRWPQVTDPSWHDSLVAASSALSGSEPNPAPNADSYYDISIKPPIWATPKNFIAAIGKLRFHEVDFDHEAPTTGHVIEQGQ